jgi:hypothetical protein
MNEGRNPLDILDEIRLTVTVSSLLAFRRIDQLNEQQQVLDPNPCAPPAYDLIRIRGCGIGPIYRYRARLSLRPQKCNPFLTPQPLTHHETESLAPQWMKRVGYPNPGLLLIGLTICIRQLDATVTSSG